MKWISVDDRLPDDDEDVLCVVWLEEHGLDNHCFIGFYDHDDVWYHAMNHIDYKVEKMNPTHWMPLPEPPKEN